MNNLDALIFPIVEGLKQLNPVQYYDSRGIEIKSQRRFPLIWECEVYSFPQTWGDGSLGFGGISGQAITTAQTVVILGSNRNDAVVYFGGRLAYHINKPNQRFMEDLHNFSMGKVSGAVSRYSRAALKGDQ